MKTPKPGTAQLENNLFVSSDSQWSNNRVQKYVPELQDLDSILISTLPMDFLEATSKKERALIEKDWIAAFPRLKKLKRLSVRHKVNQEYFESICQIPNLEELHIWTSNVGEICSLKRLKNLKHLHLESFSRLSDLSPIIQLKNLRTLSIENCFKIENYDQIGEMDWLIGLSLEGDTFAPKNLPIGSLIPFTNLKKLQHLQLSTTSIKDKSYLELLKIKSLIRLDANWRMKKEIREKVIKEHPNLKSGFFVAYDFNKNELKAGIEWWV